MGSQIGSISVYTGVSSYSRVVFWYAKMVQIMDLEIGPKWPKFGVLEVSETYLETLQMVS